MQRCKGSSGYIKIGLVSFGLLYTLLVAALWLVVPRAESGCNPPDDTGDCCVTVSVCTVVSPGSIDNINLSVDPQLICPGPGQFISAALTYSGTLPILNIVRIRRCPGLADEVISEVTVTNGSFHCRIIPPCGAAPIPDCSGLWENLCEACSSNSVVGEVSYVAGQTYSQGDCNVELIRSVTNYYLVLGSETDIDVDSDHTHDFGPPDQDDFEDLIEAMNPPPSPHEALQYVVVNNYHDSQSVPAWAKVVPGFADGFDLNGVHGDQDDVNGEAHVPKMNSVFVPIALNLSVCDLDPMAKNARVTITYDESRPENTSRTIEPNGLVAFTPATGSARLWRVSEQIPRSTDPEKTNGIVHSGSSFSLGDLPPRLYLEAVRPGSSLRSGSVRLVMTGVSCPSEDEILYTPIMVDVDVDSNNDNGFESPVRSQGEDHIEDVGWRSDSPGKILGVNDNDDDGDGIPDFADGYNFYHHVYGIQTTNDDVTTGERFTPIIFEIPEPINLSNALVRITYSASDPLAVTTNAAGFLPGVGHLRLWTHNGDYATRNPSNIVDGGHYIPQATYDAEAFGFSNGVRTLTYYIEAISNSPSGASDDGRILFEVDPDGGHRTPPNFIAADAVRTTNIKVEMAVDANRDGAINFPSALNGQTDKTSSSLPYRFWLNTDEDVMQDGGINWSDPDPERIPPRTPDRDDTLIQSTRDLEDFARLHIQISDNLITLLTQGDVLLGLKWKIAAPGAPVIRLFPAFEVDGGWAYITHTNVASLQTEGVYRNALVDLSSRRIVEPTSGSCDFAFKKSDISGPAIHLIFEGVRRGLGGCLVPVLMDAQGNVLGEGNKVWLDLYNVEELYMRAHSEPTRVHFPLPYRQDDPPSFPYAVTQTGGLVIPPQNECFAPGFDVPTTPSFIPSNPIFVPAAEEESKCIVFVHGIALSVDAVACYAASFYKRLWWEGYRGRLAVYRWSTPLDGLFKDGLYVFSDGEFMSYHSALGLKGYVESLKHQMSSKAISIAAHSLGNACAGNALRLGLTVDSYVMLEAAMSLSCYFPPPPDTDPNNDVLQNSYVTELLEAEENTPTPEFVLDQGYRGVFSSIRQNIANKWVNYYNDQDFWLATGKTSLGLNVHWVRWNQGFKPFDPWGPKNYEFDANLAEGSRCQLDLLGYNIHRPVEDVCEALAFVARSRTRAVGAEPASGNPRPLGSSLPVNLRNYEFDRPRSDHSGQFQRNIQLMYGGSGGTYATPLYRQIIRDLNME